MENRNNSETKELACRMPGELIQNEDGGYPIQALKEDTC